MPQMATEYWIWLQNLYSENRKEKMELLKGVTLGRDDAFNLSPLQQVAKLYAFA